MHRLFALTLPVLLVLAAVFPAASFAQGEEDRDEMIRKQQERMQNQLALQQMSSLARNKYTQQHLEIVPEQIKEMQPILAEYQRSQQELVRDNIELQREIRKAMADGDQQKAQELSRDLQDQIFAATSEAMEKLDKILLPHQLTRIRQIAIQSAEMHKPDSYAGLGMPLAVARQLGLSSEEIAKLKEATKEANEEFSKEVEELRERLMKNVLSSLPKDKKKEYEELVGEYFDADAARRSVFRGYREKADEED